MSSEWRLGFGGELVGRSFGDGVYGLGDDSVFWWLVLDDGGG